MHDESSDPITDFDRQFDEIIARPVREHKETVEAKSPSVNVEPDAAMVNAIYDAERGEPRFATSGQLLSLPDDPSLPPLLKQVIGVTAEAGPWLRELPVRVMALANMANADDRVLAYDDLEKEIEVKTASYLASMKQQVVALSATAGKLMTATLESGDELPAGKAREVCEYYFSLDDAGRDAFLRQAERRRDWRVLRAIATNNLVAYRAPKLDTDELLNTAGRIHYPNASILARCYSRIAERLEKNAATVRNQTWRALDDAKKFVDQERLAIVRRARGK
jgi:hypothetical protein